MTTAEKILRAKQDYDDVYKSGQSSMIDESKIIPKTIVGNPVSATDVSEIPHNLNIKLTSGTIEDFSGIEVVQTGKNLVDSDDFLKPLGSNNQIFFEKQDDGSYKSIINVFTTTRIPVNLPTGTYTVQAKIKAPKSSNYRIAFWTEDGAEAPYSITHDGENFKDVKYTLTTDKPIVAVGFYYGQTGMIEFKDLQIEYGATATEYEPYKEYKATADSSGIVEGLKSISPITHLYSNADVDVELTYNKSWGMDYEEQELWKMLLNEGKKNFFTGFFYDSSFEYIRPSYVIKPTSTVSNMFRGNPNLKIIEKDYFDFSNITTSPTISSNGYYSIFYDCSKLEEVEDCKFPSGYMYRTFYRCKNLRKIEKWTFAKDCGINDAFYGCTSLEELGAVGEIGKSIDFKSSPLNLESAISVITHLFNYKGTTDEGVYSVTFSETTWNYLDADVGIEVDGVTYSWREYISYLGWTN
jgi:hypothetical protein